MQTIRVHTIDCAPTKKEMLTHAGVMEPHSTKTIQILLQAGPWANTRQIPRNFCPAGERHVSSLALAVLGITSDIYNFEGAGGALKEGGPPERASRGIETPHCLRFLTD